MGTIPTPVVQREKRARDLKRGDWINLKRGDWINLKRGDWINLWWTAQVLFADVYTLRGREQVLVVYRDPHYNQPEVDRLDADLRVTLAAADEIPEDASASGRELDDEPGGVPAWVEGHHETGRPPS